MIVFLHHGKEGYCDHPRTQWHFPPAGRGDQSLNGWFRPVGYRDGLITLVFVTFPAVGILTELDLDLSGHSPILTDPLRRFER
jgi:hypothetical protein